MHPQNDKQLEQQIDRLLKGLPEMSAPRALNLRVMAAIEARHELPWYRRPWQTWAPALRYSSMAFLIVSFSALCFAAWRMSEAAGYDVAMEEVSEAFGKFAAVYRTFQVLISAAFLVVQHFGLPVMILCGAVALFGYVAFLGLGTVYVRLAMART